VSFVGGLTQKPYISGFIHTRENPAPPGAEGHWRYRFGGDANNQSPMFLEAEPYNGGATDTDFDTRISSNPIDVLRFSIKDDGANDDPIFRLEMENPQGNEGPKLRIARKEVEDDKDDLRIILDGDDGSFTISDGDRYGIEADGDSTLRVSTTDDDEDQEMGLYFDFASGAFKIGDNSGYGIESDGSGNFTWYEQSVDFVDDGSTIDWPTSS
jgi:hypothetical protein